MSTPGINIRTGNILIIIIIIIIIIAIETAGTWDDMAIELVQEIGRRTTVITHHHHHFRLIIMVDKRSHTIHNKNRRKMVRRPTRYEIINVKKHSDTQTENCHE